VVLVVFREILSGQQIVFRGRLKGGRPLTALERGVSGLLKINPPEYARMSVSTVRIW
jgi:hypothetical protein